MDEIQKVLIKAGRKDLAQKYYEKITKKASRTSDAQELVEVLRDLEGKFNDADTLLRRLDPHKWEQWKAGGKLVSNEFMSMYPNLIDLAEQFENVKEFTSEDIDAMLRKDGINLFVIEGNDITVDNKETEKEVIETLEQNEVPEDDWTVSIKGE